MANYGNIEDLLSGNIQRLQQQPVGINALNQSMQGFGNALSEQQIRNQEASQELQKAIKLANLDHKHKLIQQKHQAELEIKTADWANKQLLDLINKNPEMVGLMPNSGQVQSSTTNQGQQQGQMWQPPQPGPMMSYAGGGEGPAMALQSQQFLKNPVDPSVIQNGNPLRNQSMPNKIINVGPEGRFKLVDNSKFGKDTIISSISGLDINSIPKVKNEDERAQILAQLPTDLQENIQAAGEYRLDATKLYGLRNNSGDRAKFDSLVNRLYPGWDMKKYAQQQKYVNDLATGKLNQQIVSLNTLAKHLSTFEDRIDELKNTNMKPQNAIINLAKDITGDPSITDFKFAKEIVYGEMQRAVTGVGVTQEAMNRVDKMLSSDAGINQMKNNARLLKEIVRGRIAPLRSQYKNIMGKEEDGQIIFPESKAIFENRTANENKNQFSPEEIQAEIQRRKEQGLM